MVRLTVRRLLLAILCAVVSGVPETRVFAAFGIESASPAGGPSGACFGSASRCRCHERVHCLREPSRDGLKRQPYTAKLAEVNPTLHTEEVTMCKYRYRARIEA